MRALPSLTALLLLTGCDAAPKVVFTDASIILPEDPIALPEGPGRQAVIENCTACHSPSTMLQQPRIPRDKWEAQVKKMIELYKAPVDPKAVPQIIDYMMHAQSQPADVPRETPR